jgi:hypothetical protein
MMGLAVAALAWLFYLIPIDYWTPHAGHVDCITGFCAFVAFRELDGMV